MKTWYFRFENEEIDSLFDNNYPASVYSNIIVISKHWKDRTKIASSKGYYINRLNKFQSEIAIGEIQRFERQFKST